MNYCKHHFIHCIHILFKELTEIVAADLLNVMCWYTLCNIFKIIVFHYSVIFHSNGLKYSGLLLSGMINIWGCFNFCIHNSIVNGNINISLCFDVGEKNSVVVKY